MPAVVVGVVGMGHVPGIEKNWEKQLNINEIMRYVCLVVTTYHGYSVTGDYVLITLIVSPQCCPSLTCWLGAAHGHKGRHDGNTGICLLPCWREFR